MTAWLDRVATYLLHVEHDLRATLRIIRRGGTPPRLIAWDTLRISLLEARTLLRGAMPAPIAVTRSLREPHARLVAAMSVFAGHLVRLNDPMAMQHRPEIILDAATSLIEELRHWHHVVRWRAACRRAKVKIPVPPAPITTPMRLHPAEHPFSPIAELPNAWAGAQDRDGRGAGMLPSQQRARRELHALQAELDLHIPTAEVVDLRQLRLQLVPVTTAPEVRHGASAA